MFKTDVKRFIGVMMVLGLAAIFAGPAAAVEGGIGLHKIHPNMAGEEILAKAVGCNGDIAKAIVKFREANGPFKAPEDLMKVPGITKEVYEKMNPKVGPEGDLFLLPREGEKIDEGDGDAPPMTPSKC